MSMNIEIKRISKFIANSFLSVHHYLGNAPVSPLYIGFFEDGWLTAVACFGFHSSPYAPASVWHSGSNENTWELRRLSSISTIQNNESMIISLFIDYIKKHYPNIKIIMSYADDTYGHQGKIYQAANFIYAGLRETKTEYQGKLHGRTANRWAIKKNPKQISQKAVEKKTVIGRKHLYVYIIPKGRQRIRILKQLAFEPQKYPHSDTECVKTTSQKNQRTLF